MLIWGRVAAREFLDRELPRCKDAPDPDGWWGGLLLTLTGAMTRHIGHDRARKVLMLAASAAESFNHAEEAKARS